MTREQLLQFVKEEFGVLPDKPFDNDFDSMVLRHKDNKKWFALIMKVSKEKLAGIEKRLVDVLNVKCDPMIRQALLKNKGVYESYHMNKVHWVSVILEEVSLKDVVPLVEMSFDLTKKGKVGRR